MRIEWLKATGVKNLQLGQTKFRQLTVVHGPNGIGKSNLLILLHTLLSKKEHPPDLTPPAAFGIEGVAQVQDFISRGASSAEASIGLECFTTEFKRLCRAFKSAKKRPTDRIPHQVEFDFRVTPYSGGILVRVTAIRLGKVTIWSPSLASLTPEARSSLETWIEHEITDSTVYIPANRIYRRELVPLRLSEASTPVDQLENSVLKLLTSTSESPETVDKVVATLSNFFGTRAIRSEISSSVSLLDRVETLRVGVRVQEKSGEWFELGRLGTGIQQMLVILCMLHMSKARIALIEEFDSSLSPNKRSHLLELLRQLVGNSRPLWQLVATSHATFQPRIDRAASLGARRLASGKVEFVPWSKSDWREFSAGREE